MSELSDWLAERKGKRSLRDLAETARRAGKPISHANIGVYLRPGHPVPTDRVVVGLAAAFGVPESQVRRRAGIPEDKGPLTLPDETSRLTDRQRNAVFEIVMAMLHPDGGGFKVATEAVRDRVGPEAEPDGSPGTGPHGSAGRSGPGDAPAGPTRRRRRG